MVVLTVRVEVPVPPEDNVRLDGLRDIVGPAGKTDPARVTGPVKPPTLVRDTTAEPRPPAWIVIEAGLEAILKSTTLTATMTE